MATSGKISRFEVMVELRSTVEIIPGNNDVECPIYCLLSFPVMTVTEHADACCNVWVSNVSNNGKEQSQIVRMMEDKFE